KSNFSLNDAQVVGGGEKIDGDIPGSTYIYSPDGKLRLVQGERMYVEYVDKDSITDYNGQPQQIPGSITLRWPKAAYERETGELLDVELTLSNISLRVADYKNEYTDEYFMRDMIGRWPLVLMHNNACGTRDYPGCNSFDSDIRERLNPVLPSLVANTVSVPYDLVDSTSHLTYKFFKHELDPETGERIESNKEGSVPIGDFQKPGMVGTPGNWSANWDQVDPKQPHVKILSGGGCLRQPDRRIGPWVFDPGVKFGEERPCKQAWSQADHSEKVGEPYVNMAMKSGLTIELSNKEQTFINFADPACNNHEPGELHISKVGEGASVFTGKNSNGHKVTKALNGSTVEFSYRVYNDGLTPVWDIKVIDSKGVKVDCPKTVLVAGESMTCTGQGVVRAEPGK
ncbi:MAG: hypothetical protein E7K48_05895, partial [Varibaculum cambriense]|nr:hypothetical protein [Varibaculum cambriense]